MERPNITEERFDEILNQAAKLSSIIEIVCSDFEDYEIYLIVSTLFTEKIHHHSNGDQKEADKNLIYTRSLLIKKAQSMIAKENNG